MVRLTAELIITSPNFVNTLKERELDLRGNKIAQIENLGATEDQYDILDFSDNDITRLEGFPLLNRLSSLLLNNNRVTTFASGLGTKLPNLETLILTNNRVENLADLDPLVECKKLQCFSLLRNPVIKHKHYRLYVIFKLPSVRILDFQKVKAKERVEANKLFDSETGAKLVSSISQTKTQPTIATNTAAALTEEQRSAMQEMLVNAKSSEEIQRLERAIRSGKIPKNLDKETIADQDLDDGQELDEAQDQSDLGIESLDQNGTKDEESTSVFTEETGKNAKTTDEYKNPTDEHKNPTDPVNESQNLTTKIR